MFQTRFSANIEAECVK